MDQLDRDGNNGRVTAQIPDTVLLEGRELAIAGVQGTGLFDPLDHGLAPRMIHTACWRGYLCRYAVADGELVVDQLTLGAGSTLDEQEITRTTTVLGGHADTSERGLVYRDLNRPVPFTGGLLLGAGFVQSTYVHMGFHPAWKFEQVAELLAEGGRVTAVADRSEEMARLRERIQADQTADPDGGRGLPDWIERTFTLDYSRSVTPPSPERF